MRKLLVLLFVILLLLGCLGEESSKPDVGVKPDKSAPPDKIIVGEKPEIGDVVRINYIMRADGLLIDTTYKEIAKKSSDYDLIEFDHHFGFEPLTFILGTVQVNPEFNNVVKDMKTGEKKVITLPSEKTMWGARKSGLIRNMTRFTIIPREESIPTQMFNQSFGTEPELGKEIVLDFWNSTIISVENESIVIRHEPEDKIVGVPGGNITISADDEKVTMEFIPKINQSFRIKDGTLITVLDMDKTHMIVDYNHPAAGKPLEIEIVLEEISKPVSWLFNLNDSLTVKAKKPVFVLFTDVSCVECRRIEFESLTHPLTLALKDEFVWVKIDIESRQDIADQYEVEALPLVLFLNDGKELSRIGNFLPPKALRAEMESVLAST
jgi:FKBP-type peptidyl-prolyl cis-trans isomerase 2